ncbi:MAG: MFS transporter [Fimbriimonadaceae bacterium]|nr:MFS transporter [Fimbriimonadaceae bacterium]
MTGHRGVYRDTWAWNLGFSAYWFAVSYKWFILLFVLLPLQVRQFVPGGSHNSAWGTVYGLGAIWAIVGPVVFGAWSDRADSRWGHRRPFLLVGALLTLVALGVLSSAPTLLVFAIGYLLLQISDDVGTGPYGGMVPELVPEGGRGRSSAAMVLLQRLAEVASAVAAILLVTNGRIYAGIAIVTLTGAGLTLLTLRGHQRTSPKPKARPSLAQVWLEPWRSADFRWVWANRALTALAFSLVTNYLVNYLTDEFTSFRVFSYDAKTPAGAANVLAVTVSLFGAFGAVIAGSLADKIGRKRVIYLSAVLVMGALGPLALARDLTLLWLLALPFGVGFGLYSSADWALASDVIPHLDRAGSQMGLWTSSLTSVQLVVGAAGFLVDGLNRVQPGAGYTAMFWTAGVLFLIGTVLVRCVRGSR